MTASLLVLLGVFATALVAFFAWLAQTTIDIRVRVVRVEMNVESLLGTRTDQKAEVVASTAARLDKLERGND